MAPRHIWTPEERKTLAELYHNHTSEHIAKLLNLSIFSVYSQAYKLGLKKDPEFLTQPTSGRLQKGDTRGIAYRFKKGDVPANKGKKMPAEQYEKCKGTMFKPGVLPKNAKHFGKPFLYEQKTKNGIFKFWLIHVNRRRKSYMTYLLEQQGIDLTGKIPRLKATYSFANPPTLDDIYIVDMADNMAMNTINRYPEELKQTMRAIGKLRKKVKEYGTEQNY